MMVACVESAGQEYHQDSEIESIRAMVNAGSYALAATELEGLVESESDHPEAHYLLAFCRHVSNSKKPILRHYDLALHLGFSPGWVHLRRAQYYLSFSLIESAKAELQRALAVEHPVHEATQLGHEIRQHSRYVRWRLKPRWRTNVNHQLKSQSDHIEEMEARLVKLQTETLGSFAEVQPRVDSLGPRIESLHNTVSIHQRKQNELHQNTEQELHALGQEQTKTATKVDILQSAMAAFQAACHRYEGLNSTVEDLARTCSELQGTQMSLGESLRTLRSELEERKTLAAQTPQTWVTKTGLAPSVVPHHRSPSDLASRFVFVIGMARSGTTIMTETLNLSGDLLLLEEPSTFANYDTPDFTSYFNRIHEGYGNPPAKGRFLCPMGSTPLPAYDVFQRLLDQYKLVGEKIAVSAHECDRSIDRIWDFTTRNFRESSYILLVRHPAEVALSSFRKWGVMPRDSLLTWLKVLRLCIYTYRTFERTWFCSFSHYNTAVAQQLAQALGAEVSIPDNTIAPEGRRTKLQEHAAEIEDYPAELYGRCTRIYASLQDSYEPKILGLTRSGPQRPFYNAIDKLLHETLVEFEGQGSIAPTWNHRR